jgi:hypothetical protein
MNPDKLFAHPPKCYGIAATAPGAPEKRLVMP